MTGVNPTTGGEFQSGQSTHSVPHGYTYEGEVRFTPTLQPGAAQGWSTMDAPLANASAAPGSAIHRTILITRDGRRYSKTWVASSPKTRLDMLHLIVPFPHTGQA